MPQRSPAGDRKQEKSGLEELQRRLYSSAAPKDRVRFFSRDRQAKEKDRQTTGRERSAVVEKRRSHVQPDRIWLPRVPIGERSQKKRSRQEEDEKTPGSRGGQRRGGGKGGTGEGQSHGGGGMVQAAARTSRSGGSRRSGDDGTGLASLRRSLQKYEEDLNLHTDKFRRSLSGQEHRSPFSHGLFSSTRRSGDGSSGHGSSGAPAVRGSGSSGGSGRSELYSERELGKLSVSDLTNIISNYEKILGIKKIQGKSQGSGIPGSEFKTITENLKRLKEELEKRKQQQAPVSSKMGGIFSQQGTADQSTRTGSLDTQVTKGSRDATKGVIGGERLERTGSRNGESRGDESGLPGSGRPERQQEKGPEGSELPGKGQQMKESGGPEMPPWGVAALLSRSPIIQGDHQGISPESQPDGIQDRPPWTQSPQGKEAAGGSGGEIYPDEFPEEPEAERDSRDPGELGPDDGQGGYEDDLFGGDDDQGSFGEDPWGGDDDRGGFGDDQSGPDDDQGSLGEDPWGGDDDRGGFGDNQSGWGDRGGSSGGATGYSGGDPGSEFGAGGSRPGSPAESGTDNVPRKRIDTPAGYTGGGGGGSGGF